MMECQLGYIPILSQSTLGYLSISHKHSTTVTLYHMSKVVIDLCNSLVMKLRTDTGIDLLK